MAEWNWTVAEHCGRWEGLSGVHGHSKREIKPSVKGTVLLKGNAEMCVLYVITEYQGQKCG